MQINDPTMAIAELQVYVPSLEQSLEHCQTDIKGLRTEVQRLIIPTSDSDQRTPPRKELISSWKFF
jgi:hypothetical protein